MKIEVGSEWVSDTDESLEYLVLDAEDGSPVNYEVYHNTKFVGQDVSSKELFLLTKSPIDNIKEQAYEEGYVEGYNQHEYEMHQVMSEREMDLKAQAFDEGYDSGRNQWQDDYGFTVPNNTIQSLEKAAHAKGLKDKEGIGKSVKHQEFKKGYDKAKEFYESLHDWVNKEQFEAGLKEGKEFNKDTQNLNYRMGFNDGWHDCEASFELGNEFTDSIQEQAYEEGYDQAIDDLIVAGVIGESEGDYLDEDYSEYEFGAIEDDEEEYCFSKELARVLNGEFTSNINFDGKKKEELDEYNGGYGEAKVDGTDGSERKHSHYFKDVRHLDYIDVYQVCKLFPVDDDSGAITHSIKKLLVAGGRGAGKDMIKDITEARDTLNRYLQIEGIE